MPTSDELKFLQSQSLERKIMITQTRIMEWYNRFDGNVYVSFSGGKDSTVLLDITRKMYPDIEAVFVDTGLEYPEIREFVKTKDNVTWLRPTMKFPEVIEKYGWNYPGKEMAKNVYYARKGSKWAIDCFNGVNADGTENKYRQRNKKWAFLVESSFKISNQCCLIIKEKPIHQYEKMTKKYPILGLMTDESMKRKQAWLKTGCNSFGGQRPVSKPLSFWTEQDVLEYIVRYEIPYATVYGKIVKDKKNKWHTTGEQRTGCMFCPVGCHLENPVNRFQRMKTTHPKQWDYCINQLGLGEFLDFVGVPYGKEELDNQTP